MHVDGDLVLLPKDLQHDLFKQVETELASVKHQKVIFLAPLPRYYTQSCCADPDHVGNRKQDGFQRNMEDGIFVARTNIKNFAFRYGFRQCTTVSAWGKVKKIEELWEDQVMMKEGGYDTIAKAIMEAGMELEKKRKN
jgi:hypothetical protein